jgi:hypothetical protein
MVEVKLTGRTVEPALEGRLPPSPTASGDRPAAGAERPRIAEGRTLVDMDREAWGRASKQGG